MSLDVPKGYNVSLPEGVTLPKLVTGSHLLPMYLGTS